ncbi:MAG: beta-ketoacyl-ACP synthase II, partial [Polaribacter sp.]
LNDYWKNLVMGVSGAAPITHFDTSEFKTKFACEVKDFVVKDHLDRREAQRMDPFTQYAMVSSMEAIKDANLYENDTVNHDRIGVIWGAGIGGINIFQEQIAEFATGTGTPRFNPFFIPKMIIDIAPGHISMKHNFRGPNFAAVSACASSTNAMIDAFNYIRLGKADAIVTGGSEAAVTYGGIGGFNSMKALSTRNDDPKTASRPFDSTRDGFIMGEGSGSLIFEEYEHAVARGAKIYCEVAGGGLSADAHHLTAPHPEGLGAMNVMKNALEDAEIDATAIDYINVHGTSTPLGDIAELKAVKAVFGEHAYNLNISSTKSMTGHLLGSAGAIEAIACVKAIEEGIVPPTINHVHADENIDQKLNLTLNKAQKREVKFALNNTFGFGGHNASVIFKKL